VVARYLQGANHGELNRPLESQIAASRRTLGDPDREPPGGGGRRNRRGEATDRVKGRNTC